MLDGLILQLGHLSNPSDGLSALVGFSSSVAELLELNPELHRLWVLSLCSSLELLGKCGPGEYFLDLWWGNLIILYQIFYSLVEELKVGDDEIMFIMNEVLKFIFDHACECFIIHDPRLCFAQELPVICFLDEPM